ncbi:MAG: N-ethylammeline chlorohydrolase [Bdellovibrionaceae bacterium]|nr:N-ethylammeline chlorohydrolase [Pseudobdellovibrionaceae bacterium]
MKNSETWILNPTIVTQNKNRDIYNGHIRISDNRIVEIRKTSPKVLSDQKVIDAKGLTIVPGFVQAHTHLCQTLFRNLADDLELLDWLQKRIWPMEASHTPETLETSVKMGIYELLSSGTTCVLDMGTVRHTEVIIQTVKKLGLRGSFGKCLMDHPDTTPQGLREPTEQAIKEAKDLFEKWNGAMNDRIRISYAPRFVISCTEKLLKEIAKLAMNQKALIHTHASENRKEIELVRSMTGLENIEYLDHLQMTGKHLVLAHCIWLSSKEMNILKKTGTHVCHCPSSNLKLASGFAKIPEMLTQKINIALGADGAPCNNNLNQFQEMRFAALIHKPTYGPRTMDAQTVLDMATLHGAKALQWSDDIGSIEVGKKADFFAIDLDRPESQVPFTKKIDSQKVISALVYSAQSAQIQWTMVDGKRLYDRGKVKGIKTSVLNEEIKKAQKKILNKIKS